MDSKSKRLLETLTLLNQELALLSLSCSNKTINYNYQYFLWSPKGAWNLYSIKAAPDVVRQVMQGQREGKKSSNISPLLLKWKSTEKNKNLLPLSLSLPASLSLPL